MHEDQMYNAEFELSNGDTLSIAHNIGKFVTAAFDNWIVRTDTYTEKSLCEYIKSKDPVNIIAMPMEEYREIMDETETE
jgi:hypothetical protein